MESMQSGENAGNKGPMLISGASGIVGTALRHVLAARHSSVRQLVRGAVRAPGQITWNPDARPAVTDADALEGCSAAFHLSGASIAGRRWTAAYRNELVTSRVETTRVLAETLASLRIKPKVLVVASAVGIYGDRGDEVLDESSSAGTGFLADLCRNWEKAARPAQDAGIRVVHARFGVVLGKHGGALAKMLPLFRAGLGGKLGSGRQWVSWISLEDAVAALLFAADTSSIAGAVNLTAPQPVTNAEFTGALARALHRPSMMPAPAFALRLALGQMANETLLASQRAVPSKLLEAGFHFTHPALDDALQAALS
jgi:uncharacterized protein (TIGR01777 family)